MHHCQGNKAHDIDESMTLSAVDVLSGVIAADAAAFSGFDGLTIDDGSSKLELATSLFADSCAKLTVNFLPDSCKTEVAK